MLYIKSQTVQYRTKPDGDNPNHKTVFMYKIIIFSFIAFTFIISAFIISFIPKDYNNTLNKLFMRRLKTFVDKNSITKNTKNILVKDSVLISDIFNTSEKSQMQILLHILLSNHLIDFLNNNDFEIDSTKNYTARTISQTTINAFKAEYNKWNNIH